LDEIWTRLLVTGLLVLFGLYAGTVVSGRRRAREALRERDWRIHTVFENMAEGLVLMDSSGRIVEVNPAGKQILGLERRDCGYAGPKWRIIEPDGTPVPADAMVGHRALAEARAFRDVVRGVERDDGHVTWISVNATPVPCQSGECMWVTLTFTDITALKCVQDELKATHESLERRVEQRTHAVLHQTEKLAMMQERARLARDLHDSVTQTLFSAGLIADALPRLWERDEKRVRSGLEDVRRLTREALVAMRTLLLELRPESFAAADLRELMRHLADLFSRRGLSVEVETDGPCSAPTELKGALYRIASEALANAARHSGAARTRVTLRRGPERSELVVVDDGRGFEPADVGPGSLGLSIMRERAEAAGLELRVESHEGGGTRIVAAWENHVESPRVATGVGA
jgi:PAS domain S-box-containing protein